MTEYPVTCAVVVQEMTVMLRCSNLETGKQKCVSVKLYTHIKELREGYRICTSHKECTEQDHRVSMAPDAAEGEKWRQHWEGVCGVLWRSHFMLVCSSSHAEPFYRWTCHTALRAANFPSHMLERLPPPTSEHLEVSPVPLNGCGYPLVTSSCWAFASTV